MVLEEDRIGINNELSRSRPLSPPAYEDFDFWNEPEDPLKDIAPEKVPILTILGQIPARIEEQLGFEPARALDLAIVRHQGRILRIWYVRDPASWFA